MDSTEAVVSAKAGTRQSFHNGGSSKLLKKRSGEHKNKRRLIGPGGSASPTQIALPFAPKQGRRIITGSSLPNHFCTVARSSSDILLIPLLIRGAVWKNHSKQWRRGFKPPLLPG